MKIVLINPPIRLNKPPESFPLGLGYISSVLLNEGHEVEVLDINATRISKDLVIKNIKKSNFDIIGIGGIVTTYKYVKLLTHEIKKIKPKTKIILGGGVGASIPELAFNKMNIDFIVIEEGERTIVELLDKLDKPNKVKGIYYKEDEIIHKRPERLLIKNLDELPFPAWDLFPMGIYTKPIAYSGWTNKMNMIYGRGCPFGCTYCWHNFGRTNRLRSPDNVIEEIKLLKKKYKIKYITFHDECLTTNKENILEFCDRLIEEGLNIKWDCPSRVNLIDEEMLKAMKKAGCNNIGYGIESGSQKMLDFMNKGVTVEQAKKAILLTKKSGIKPHATFMIGTPGETKETIWETVKFCKEVKLSHRIEIFFTTPFPSTPLYEYSKEKGLIKNEEEYIEKLGNVADFTLNLTDMPDKELVRLRKCAQKEASISSLRWILEYYNDFGFFSLIKSFIKKFSCKNS